MKRLLSFIAIALLVATPQISFANDYDFAQSIPDPDSGKKTYGISPEHDFKSILTGDQLLICAEANRNIKLGREIEEEDAFLSKMDRKLRSIIKRIKPGDTVRINRVKKLVKLQNSKVAKLKGKKRKYQRVNSRNPYTDENEFEMYCNGSLYYSSDE